MSLFSKKSNSSDHDTALSAGAEKPGDAWHERFNVWDLEMQARRDEKQKQLDLLRERLAASEEAQERAELRCEVARQKLELKNAAWVNDPEAEDPTTSGAAIEFAEASGTLTAVKEKSELLRSAIAKGGLEKELNAMWQDHLQERKNWRENRIADLLANARGEILKTLTALVDQVYSEGLRPASRGRHMHEQWAYKEVMDSGFEGAIGHRAYHRSVEFPDK